MQLDYSDLRLVATGETLSAESYARLRASKEQVTVLVRDAVADHAAYEAPALPSTGYKYVLVGGVAVVDTGRLVARRRRPPGTYAHRPLRGRTWYGSVYPYFVILAPS